MLNTIPEFKVFDPVFDYQLHVVKILSRSALGSELCNNTLCVTLRYCFISGQTGNSVFSVLTVLKIPPVSFHTRQSCVLTRIPILKTEHV